MRVFSGERGRANAKLAELEAANAELRDQQEIRVSEVLRESAGWSGNMLYGKKDALKI